MNRRIPSKKDIHYNLLANEGYSFPALKFSKEDLEQEFQEFVQKRLVNHWWKALRFGSPIAALAILLHLVSNTGNIPTALILTEISALVAACILHLLAYKGYANLRFFRFTTVFILILPLLIFALSRQPDKLVGLPLLGIFIAGFLPVHTRVQLIYTIISTLTFAAVMFLRAPFELMFIIYNLMFAILVAIVTGSSALSRDVSERSNFFLQRKTDELLFNTLPPAIASELRESPSGSDRFTKRYDNVTVMFVDIVGFTAFCSRNSPEAVVSHLDHIFRRIDAICDQIGIEKIKTIGDAYLAVAGIPHPVPNHTDLAIDAAFEIREAVRKISHLTDIELDVRIGIHRGPVVAGIIGKSKLQYDVWGDTVNVASRLEAQGKAGKIYVSAAVHHHAKKSCECGTCTILTLKGLGDFPVFELVKPKVDFTQPEMASDMPPDRTA
jgi:class 3 adenylate cyclase